MGYVYGFNERGRMVLSCDNCGEVGGVRKRRCPVNYCPAPALCSGCWRSLKADGSVARWHADCPAASARYRAEIAAREAEPDRWVRSARGDWAPDVPAGMVAATLYSGRVVLIPKDEYDPYKPVPGGA